LESLEQLELFENISLIFR